MSFIVMIKVQMPDGTFQFRPVAVNNDLHLSNPTEVPHHSSMEEARLWVDSVLPLLAQIVEEPDTNPYT